MHGAPCSSPFRAQFRLRFERRNSELRLAGIVIVCRRADSFCGNIVRMSVRRTFKTVRALLRPVLLSILIAEAGLFVVRTSVSPNVLRDTNDVVGNYLQTLGTIYAVLLAFVVFVVWSQFNDARSYVEREANELLDLFRTSKRLPAERRAAIQSYIGKYVGVVLEREWPAMAKSDNSQAFEEGGAILDQLWDVLHDFEPNTTCHAALHSEILSRFNDLSDVRTNRLTSGQLRIPLALKILIYTGAVLTVGSMYLFSLQNWVVHALMTGAMAGALSHILYLIHDLDNCFAGDWQVPRSAFQRVQQFIQNPREAKLVELRAQQS